MSFGLMWHLWCQDWRARPLQTLTPGQNELMARYPFLRTARPDQKPPAPGPGETWRNWLMMGGRGAGKTRAGAEFVRFAVTTGMFGRVALVGPTLGDVREVMIEGPSGLKAIEQVADWYPHYNASRRRLEWPFGAVASIYSAEEADRLRGPQFDVAWCDEIASWTQGELCWDMLQLALRLGQAPCCVATTTPRPVPLVRRLVAGEARISRARTADNRAFLAPGFVDQVSRAYAGTPLGRQELNGELIEDPQGALWTRSMIEAARVTAAPDRFEDLVIAVDPPASSGPRADQCGIIAVGVASEKGFGRRAFVLRDGTVQGLRPADWGARVATLTRETGARAIVAEANQGGEMIRAVLEHAACGVPVELRHARLGKRARAAPVAALYGRGRVSHVGVFAALEDEMCRFGADGLTASPDRVDALVWAVSALVIDPRGVPRLRAV